MNHLSRYDRSRIFGKILDRVIYHLEFKTCHDYNAIAKILEARALYLRHEADELLSDDAEVPTKE
jgi:hypothetical protein